MSTLASELSLRYGTTGVHALEKLVPSARYEAALIFGLPEALSDYVGHLRAELAFPAPAELLLVPHLTVLFLGRWPAAQLGTYLDALSALGPLNAPTVLEALDVFVIGDRLTNIHLRAARTEALHASHLRSLEACRRAGWNPPGRHFGVSYRPHVTVLDGLDLDPSMADEIRSRPVRHWSVNLTELCIIGKVVEAGDA